MTLVFNSSLGKLVQTQFGMNEISSAVIVGKAVGSLLSRQTDGTTLGLLAAQNGNFVRRIPQYLENVIFHRSGTMLGDRQRKISVENTLEGVTINSVEGIATFMILILRHVESMEDIVDYLEDLLRGEFWLVGSCQREDEKQTRLPYTARQILRTFINGVIDADKDSQQLNETRRLMSALVMCVGSAKFLEPMSSPAQHHLEGFLRFLLSNARQDLQPNEHLVFDTLAAGGAMTALAAAANGAAVKVQCWMGGHQGRPVVLSEPPRLRRGSDTSIEFNLWLSQPPPGVSERLRLVSPGEHYQPRTIFSGMLPILGGMAEVSKIVARQLKCEDTSEELLAFWKVGVGAGSALTWKARLKNPAQYLTLACYIEQSSLCYGVRIPPSLRPFIAKYLKAPRGDPRHKLVELAASVYHDVLNWTDYAGFDESRLGCTLRFIIIAIFTGAIGKLASNPTGTLTHYAWSANCDQFYGFAETAVSRGLDTKNVILASARIWGGLTPAFKPEIATDQFVVGIACPQVTILMNILSHPETVAVHGIGRGLFTLHQGSIPTIPRHPSTGLILAGTKPFRKSAFYFNARDPMPIELSDE